MTNYINLSTKYHCSYEKEWKNAFNLDVTCTSSNINTEKKFKIIYRSRFSILKSFRSSKKVNKITLVNSFPGYLTKGAKVIKSWSASF